MQIDILDPQLYRADPYPTYAWLRKHAPIYWDERQQLWVVSKYEDVVYVSKNPKLFCSGFGVRPNLGGAAGSVKLSIIDTDEPRHGQLRRLVNRGFTPGRVNLLEPRIRKMITQSIDAVATQGECDFVQDIAVPLPLLVISDLLGIRREDHDRFQQWSDAMIGSDGFYDDPEVMQKAGAAFAELAAYMTSIIEERRKQPQDDLVSILVGAHDDGILDPDEAEITNDELLMFMTLLLVAGNETTRNAMTGGMIALIQHPQEREKLLRNPKLILSAVDEIVRWVSPVLNFKRTVTQDTELRGQALAQGDSVLLLYGSANRDEAQFEDPDHFKVERKPNNHVGFGMGNHFCLGANLARLELRVAFEELLRRLPDMLFAPGSQPEVYPSTLVRSFVHLPVIFTPERPRSRARPSQPQAQASAVAG
ncbi:MAG: cytochrome P450 [Myxococcales bacterium]|nr:cytochrome P450 [Myxococcales bacterium]